ncbi:glutamate dehydrogenase, mitochondrial-like [Agrilus planipennis]|uniref:Glutamate dehydrogenase n=1 Tax=Agrilus planipennis TaxID=224129 RepID=A0A1W4WER3_AGRPL|nr:glutamate dehydrogenase, mitochondrial-like [Agrilus planipennis]
MKFILDFFVRPCHRRFYSRNHPYDFPEKLRDAFYCANAFLVDSVRWYKHTAIEHVYSDLVNEVRRKNPSLPVEEARQTVKDLIDAGDVCSSVLEINCRVKLQDGRKRVVKGYRVQNSSLLSNQTPCIGGLRLLRNEQKHELRGLAILTSQRNACMRIPLLGSHGSILIDPNEFKRDDTKEILQKYTSELYKRNFCGNAIDIFEPDIGTSCEEMEWIANTPNTDTNCIPSSFVIGKPDSFVNSVGNYNEILKDTIAYTLELFLNDEKIMKTIELETGLKNKSFILQGLGKYGYLIGSKLQEEGAICVGIDDNDCFTYYYDGLDIDSAYSHKQKFGTLKDFHFKTKPYHSDSILNEECDLLVLAGKQNGLVYNIADKLQAKVIVEAAYGAITPTSHKILIGTNKLIIPDIVTNGGFAVLSYMEHLKNVDYVEKGEITQRFSDSIKDYYVMVCPREEAKLIVNFSGNIVQYPNDIFPETLSETELIKGIIEGSLNQAVKEVLATAKHYKLGLDFRTAAHCKALLQTYKHIFESQLY